MSKTRRISYVVEGATDFIVLDALVARFLQTEDYVATQVQPPLSEFTDHLGPLGGGWRGVLKWCESAGANSEGFAESTTLANCDCLIIHLDADIATENELTPLALAVPCPPAKDTCDKIREHLILLLGGSIPPNVILCVPAQCTEAWVFAALHPDLVSTFKPIECRPEVERLLIGKPDRLVRDKDGRAKKQTDRYRHNADKIAAHWPDAVAACTEAARFEAECTNALSK